MSEEQVEESQVEAVDATAEEVSEPQQEVADVGTESHEQPVAQQPQSAWDAFKALPNFEGADDRTIATSLYTALQRQQEAEKAISQYKQVAPLAQEYLENKQQFEAWRQGQQQPVQQQVQPQMQQPPQEPEQPRWWNPPEVRESYKQYLVKDENGRETIHPDAPLEAKHSLYEYQKYKSDFAQKFLANPEEALGPMVEEIASKRAESLVQEQMQGYQQQQWVDGLETENKDWLYEEDGSTPSEEGLAAKNYIEQLTQMGVQDHQQKWEITQRLVERDLMEKIINQNSEQEQQQQFEQNLPQNQENQEFIEKNQPEEDMNYLRREASRSPSRAAPARAGSSQGPLSFEQRLAKAMRVSPQDE